jgi:hypothetical protein
MKPRTTLLLAVLVLGGLAISLPETTETGNPLL